MQAQKFSVSFNLEYTPVYRLTYNDNDNDFICTKHIHNEW